MKSYLLETKRRIFREQNNGNEFLKNFTEGDLFKSLWVVAIHTSIHFNVYHPSRCHCRLLTCYSTIFLNDVEFFAHLLNEWMNMSKRYFTRVEKQRGTWWG